MLSHALLKTTCNVTNPLTQSHTSDFQHYFASLTRQKDFLLYQFINNSKGFRCSRGLNVELYFFYTTIELTDYGTFMRMIAVQLTWHLNNSAFSKVFARPLLHMNETACSVWCEVCKVSISICKLSSFNSATFVIIIKNSYRHSFVMKTQRADKHTSYSCKGQDHRHSTAEHSTAHFEQLGFSSLLKGISVCWWKPYCNILWGVVHRPQYFWMVDVLWAPAGCREGLVFSWHCQLAHLSANQVNWLRTS